MATIGAPGCTGGGDTAPTSTPTPAIAGSFTLSAPKALTVLQGGGGESTIAITRTGGFVGNIALTVTGDSRWRYRDDYPSSTSGTTATLVVTTLAEVPAGTLTLTINGMSAGQSDHTTAATVAISPNTGGTGNVSLDFSNCPATSKPIWVAYQDGDGAWTQIIGAADVYRFNVAAAKGGYAFVSRGVTATLNVSLATRAELTRSTNSPCGVTVGGLKQLSGTVTGLGSGEVAYVGLGGTYSDPEGGPVVGTFTLFGVHDGNQDLIAYRSSASLFGPRERVIVRRDQNIANNGTLGVLDFDGSESFAPAIASVTVAGNGSGQAAHYMAYYAGAQCSYYDLYDDPSSGGSFLMRASRPRGNDPTSFTGSWCTRVTRPDMRSKPFIRSRTESLPCRQRSPRRQLQHRRADTSAFRCRWPCLTSIRKRCSCCVSFQNAAAYVTASFGWLGGASATLALPDFSGVTGWSGSFLPTSSASARWYIAATGANVAQVDARSTCVENGRLSARTRTGSGSSWATRIAFSPLGSRDVGSAEFLVRWASAVAESSACRTQLGSWEDNAAR